MTPRPQEPRSKLAGPASIAALAGAALAGLATLFLRAGDPRRGPARSAPDSLSVAYLQAMVARRPGDVATRCELARAQLALGQYRDAERTLAPLLGRDAGTAEPELLGVDAAVAAWRAAPPGSPERAAAAARAQERLERLLEVDPTPAEFDHLAAEARELGRNDLAARAHESAAALDRAGCARWLSLAGRDYLAAGDQRGAAGAYLRAYQCSGEAREAMSVGLEALDACLAAGMVAEARHLADRLVERFPQEVAVLQRAEAIALGQGDPEGARRLGERLVELGLADPVSLGRQLDLDLAAGDLPGALRVAERLAAQSPGDARSHLTAARVATWAGRPDAALRHRIWLARHGGAQEAEEALGLARALGDAAAVAELLTLRSRREALPPAALAELAGALREAGPPGGAAAALGEYARRHPASREAWDQLARAQERDGDLSAAVATRSLMSRRFGRSLATSVQLARLKWEMGRPGDALSELEPWSRSADPGEVDYWQMLAELAWDREADDLAGRAYRALWEAGRIDARGAERLFQLSRDAGRHRDAIRYGREGWVRTHQPRLLLLAMDEASRAGWWDVLERVAAEAASSPQAFAGFPAYWMLRARLDERAGRSPEALDAYRRALAADPRSAAARSGVIWLLAGSHDLPALARCLGTWQADAWNDPGLWRAYASGLEQLGRLPEALAFREREARADPGDAAAMRRLSRALRLAGDGAAAARIDDSPALRRSIAPLALAPWSASADAAVTQTSPAAGGPWAGPDDVGTAGGASGRFRSLAAAVAAEAAAESFGLLALRQGRAVARSEVAGAELEARLTLTRYAWRDPGLPPPGDETEALARASFPALGGRNELAVGASLRPDGDLPRAEVAHARDLPPSGRLRLAAALDEPADESAVLRAESARSRAGGALAAAGGSFDGRLGLDWKRWATRGGAELGTGGAATAEAGWRLRARDPDLRLRLQGSYQRTWQAMGPAAEALVALAPGTTRLLPPELAGLGLGAGVTGWQLGPARLAADGWMGWMWPPSRPAFRGQIGVSGSPFRGSELSLAGFAGNDRWTSSGDYGVRLALTWSFSR